MISYLNNLTTHDFMKRFTNKINASCPTADFINIW